MGCKNERRCASCGRLGPKSSFWRIVRVHPSHQLQLETGMGRSAYLCPAAACLKVAQKKNRLGRALRAPVGDDLYQSLWRRLSLETPSEATVNYLQGTTEHDVNEDRIG
ncbi:MAG: YlxR family protein [Geitlerinemataceae cyanobacterium]